MTHHCWKAIKKAQHHGGDFGSSKVQSEVGSLWKPFSVCLKAFFLGSLLACYWLRAVLGVHVRA